MPRSRILVRASEILREFGEEELTPTEEMLLVELARYFIVTVGRRKMFRNFLAAFLRISRNISEEKADRIASTRERRIMWEKRILERLRVLARIYKLTIQKVYHTDDAVAFESGIESNELEELFIKIPEELKEKIRRDAEYLVVLVPFRRLLSEY